MLLTLLNNVNKLLNNSTTNGYKKPWSISATQLDEVLATDPYFAHSKDPDTEDIFITEDNASVGSAKSSMEEDDPLTTSSQ
ncbi:hypothetical protein G6F16_014182 [Rhizopus arrhizus]|uniref:Uncharacterized protein n=1 Tax=Rhizopus oryzae TaxID=64495 RepID=A0A9P6WTW8_RHIOR|nr:hypothetical protein G6F23_013621 [Rhizopus arrhizus]KAG0740187.1 hypothetical protein G6F24_017099 [Rhizopus arrhizus]KAG0803248.1 hypothetical protein G6F20_013688 [Rhizopus arrhizus]KAG0804143.1 hypothetical protein G6F19_014198 [Rhizopus arrhizus]KAG0804272.1 hypothetical protein G6F18_014256 [Rhizopus arrhizus]